MESSVKDLYFYVLVNILGLVLNVKIFSLFSFSLIFLISISL